MNEEMYEYYHTNKEFKEYVDSYCKHRGLGIFEALGHITIKEVAKYYRDKSKDVIEPARQQASCDTRR